MMIMMIPMLFVTIIIKLKFIKAFLISRYKISTYDSKVWVRTSNAEEASAMQ